ncbi:MAG: glycosyltransferase family 2 protein [Pedobacter sp.]|nr:MAG: glycosyltransferase family 2 protein [Pedobacter sp.]
MTKISVCMATYNGAKFIQNQIDSIIKQLGKDDEIIISDDSSTDNTIEIIQSFKDDRIKLFPNQKFRSPITNFENALQLATGEIIFLADQDDIWHDSKVEKMAAALENADMAVCDCSFIDDNNKITLDSYFKLVSSSSGVIRNLKKNTYFGCCMAFRKRILKKAIPFPKDIPMHDIWLGFVSDLCFKSVFINESLTYYRKHNNNASIASDVISNLSLLTKLKFRYNVVKYLPVLLLR